MRDLYDDLLERRRRPIEVQLSESDTLLGSLDLGLPFACFREFIADVDCGNDDGAFDSDDTEQVRLSKQRRGRG